MPLRGKSKSLQRGEESKGNLCLGECFPKNLREGGVELLKEKLIRPRKRLLSQEQKILLAQKENPKGTPSLCASSLRKRRRAALARSEGDRA